jgi:hypothetical protein
MNEILRKYRIDAKNNYYTKFAVLTGVLFICATILQLVQHSSLLLSLFLFAFFESFFLFKKQIISVSIEENIISIIYFQYLKKFSISSKIDEAKINKHFNTSLRSPEKKVTLSIIINNKKFEINKLDNFDEDDLTEFYDFFMSMS